MQRLNEVLQRNAEGYIGAREATKIAREEGKLLVGTAVSLDEHVPSLLLNADPGHWALLLQNTRGGATPAFRATTSPDIALWCGFGGNPNKPLQRIVTPGVRPILPETSQFDLGTFGWDAPRGYNLFKLHHDIPPFVEGLSDDTVIGAVDIIDRPPHIAEQPGEPGNFFVYSTAQTIGSIVVRMGDVRDIPYDTQFFEDRYRSQ